MTADEADKAITMTMRVAQLHLRPNFINLFTIQNKFLMSKIVNDESMPGVKDAAANGSESTEPKKKVAKTKLPSKAEIIFEFLGKCTIYEADAVRIVNAAVCEGRSADSIDGFDRLALNRYFNAGWDKKRDGDAKLQENRNARAFHLMDTAYELFDKDEYRKFTVLAMSIANDVSDIANAIRMANSQCAASGQIPDLKGK